MTVLLSGVVGSTAYGLAQQGSDIDVLSIAATDTIKFHGLTPPTETYVSHNPDVTVHEAGKACRLMLQCNPTLVEFLYLNNYTMTSELGLELISIRSSFLSAKRVKDAYLGYAVQQFKRLKERGDGSFSADTRKRTEKHARHMWRLVEQGYDLYTTGELTIKVKNPAACRGFGEAVAKDAGLGEFFVTLAKKRFEESETVLPEEPDKETVERWLRKVRHAHYEYKEE